MLGVRVSPGAPNINMFFELSNSTNNAFTHSYIIGNKILSTDDGWKEFTLNGKKAVAKGYTFEVPLEVAAFEPPKYRGMFCSIVETSDGIMITHGIPRGFPIYQLGDIITNFQLGKKFPCDVFYCNSTLKRFSKIFPKTPTLESLTIDEAVGLIDTYIEENIKGFLKFENRVIKVAVTGGLDTTLIYSYFDSLTIPHIPVIDRIFELDEFVIKNYDHLNHVAGYTADVNHYREPTILTSGGNGDHYFLRSREAMSWIDSEGKYIYDDSDYDNLTYSHRHNFTSLYNVILSSCYIWHLTNTTYFNPLMDIRIPLTVMAIKKDELYQASRTGEIQKKLIARRSPWMIELLAGKKMPAQQLKFLPEVLKRISSK